MPTVDTKVSEMDLLASLLDNDLAMIVRPISVSEFDNFGTLLSTLKTYINSETSGEITANGAIPLNKNNIVLNVGSGGTVNLTLANGTDNQVITIVAKQAASNIIITPANFTSTNITVTLTGQTITLKFKETKWYVISNYGTTIA